MKKAVLGLSGGVDSALAALRLRAQGYTVEGVWLDLGFGSPEPARRASAELGVGFSVFDASAAHEALVRAPFAAAYRSGRTPNPCARCNPSVKLPSLMAAGEPLGADKIATGHYAAVEERAGRFCLRASGGDKDQSYMLALLPQSLLARLLLPLAGLDKAEVRRLAREAGLSAFDAPDSQDICFIPDGDYGAYLERRGDGLPPGDFIDAGGRVLGRHGGLHRYTVGQRRGLGVSADSRLYVKALLPETNRVLLAREEELLVAEIVVRNANWVSVPPRKEAFRAEVKIRSGPRSRPARLYPAGETLRVCFEAPLRRPAPGQLAVAYEDGFVLFGGEIV